MCIFICMKIKKTKKQISFIFLVLNATVSFQTIDLTWTVTCWQNLTVTSTMAFQRVTWRLRLQHGSFIRWHLWWQRLAVIKTKKERKRKTNIYRIQEQTRNSWSKVRERHDFQALKLDERVWVYQLVLVFRNSDEACLCASVRVRECVWQKPSQKRSRLSGRS